MTAWVPHANDTFMQPRVVAATSETSTTDTTLDTTVLDSMSIANVILDGSQSVLASLFVTFYQNTADNEIQYQIQANDVAVNSAGSIRFSCPTAAEFYSTSQFVVHSKPAAGNYTYDVKWAVPNGGTGTTSNRILSVVVLPSA